MTLKQTKLVKAYLKTGNKTQAAIAAGYSPKSAHTLGHEALKIPEVAAHLNRLMDRAGLSEKRLLDPIRDGLKAREVFEVVETDAPDHANRLKSSELAWKLRGYKNGNGNGNGNGHGGETHVHITVNVEAPKEALAGSILAHLSRRTALAADHA